jgi:hypothetical protein
MLPRGLRSLLNPWLPGPPPRPPTQLVYPEYGRHSAKAGAGLCGRADVKHDGTGELWLGQRHQELAKGEAAAGGGEGQGGKHGQPCWPCGAGKGGRWVGRPM